MDEIETLARVFKLLGDANRLRLLRLMGAEGLPHGLCCKALASALGISPPAVSQHLALLRAYDLVISRKQGCFVHCRLNRARLADYMERMAAFFEAGRAPECTCDASQGSMAIPGAAVHDGTCCSMCDSSESPTAADLCGRRVQGGTPNG